MKSAHLKRGFHRLGLVGFLVCAAIAVIGLTVFFGAMVLKRTEVSISSTPPPVDSQSLPKKPNIFDQFERTQTLVMPRQEAVRWDFVYVMMFVAALGALFYGTCRVLGWILSGFLDE